ncbi:hypothetical protein ACS0TY_032912 [Phlomoides rotata]
MGKVAHCNNAKEIWETLELMCQGMNTIKENKLSIAIQKFESFEMLSNETIDELDSIFTTIMNEMNTLGKKYPIREIALKIIRALPEKWDVFTVMFQNTKDLTQITAQQPFSELKAFEFDLNRRKSVKPSKIKNGEASKNVALKAKKAESTNVPSDNLSKAEMRDEFNLMERRFEKLNSIFGKYKRFYQDTRNKRRYSQPSGGNKRTEDKYPEDRKVEGSSSRKDKKKVDEEEDRCYQCN